MRSLLDLRLSRLTLVLLAAVSGVATAIILIGGNDRTPAQMAALAALRERPMAARSVATAPAARTSPGGSAAAARGQRRHAGGGGSAPAPSATPSATPPAGAAASAPPPTTSSPPPTTTPTTSTSTTTSTTSSAPTDLPKVGHVFELTLSAKSYAAVFGTHSQMPYLHSLVAKGTLLTSYRSLGAGELADELALVSGQAPNADTTRGCRRYADFPSGAVANTAGSVSGHGCVYPDTALTIGDQVTAAGKRWHAYVADMGNQACLHPNSDAVDDTALPFSDPGYDTRHNPFIYFHSLLDLGDCSSDDVDLSHLGGALHAASATPTFSYLAASACADGDPAIVPAAASGTTSGTASGTTSGTASGTTSGSATGTTGAETSSTTGAATTSTKSTTTTTSSPGATTTTAGAATSSATAPAGCPPSDPAGARAEDTFLHRWIPRILASAGYRRNGMLIIAIAGDGAASGHPIRTGALVLSRWASRGRRLATAADPYALLRLTEDALGYKRLAHAASAPAIAQQVLGTARS